MNVLIVNADRMEDYITGLELQLLTCEDEQKHCIESSLEMLIQLRNDSLKFNDNYQPLFTHELNRNHNGNKKEAKGRSLSDY